MIVRSSHEFQSALFDHLSFTAFIQKNCTLYKNASNPNLGHTLQYTRPNYYEFGIANYTIPDNFELSFHNPTRMMRFGVVYTGTSIFKLENEKISTFTPSSFFVVEENLKGQQVWKEGQHFHGAEITIYEDYFKEVIYPNFPDCISFDQFITNHTYNYLPLGIVSIIQQLNTLSATDSLTPLYLESKILECIAIIANELTASFDNAFTNQLYYGEIQIGKKRKTRLTSTDIHAIQKAHNILTTNACSPPTIENLSKMVFLNEQKLKAGFSSYYHNSIGQYTNTIRMTMAANLLATTTLSIEEIALKVGYHHSSNFSKMFQKTYGKSPIVFRKTKQ